MKQPELSDKSGPISRRAFAAGAVATVSAAFLPAPVGALDKAASRSGQAPEERPGGLSASDWREVHARYSNLLRVYGSKLSEEEKARVLTILTTNQHMLASIRRFDVQNGDPMACTLRVYKPQ